MDFTVESLFPKTTKLITELSKANADGILPRVQTISPLVHDIGEKDVYIYFTYADKAKGSLTPLVKLIEEVGKVFATQNDSFTPLNFVFYFEAHHVDPTNIGGMIVAYTTLLIDLLELKEKGVFDFTYTLKPLQREDCSYNSGTEYLIASSALASAMMVCKTAYDAGKNNR